MEKTLRDAMMILYRHGFDMAGDLIEEVLNDYSRKSYTRIDAPMTEDERDILGEAINACDKLGKYGTGDAIMTALTFDLNE